MIIVQLIGGLGNQMFQYAFARKVAHKNNTDLKIDNIRFAQDELPTSKQVVNSDSPVVAPKDEPSFKGKVIRKLWEMKRDFYSLSYKEIYHEEFNRVYGLKHFNISGRPLGFFDILKIRLGTKLKIVDKQRDVATFQQDALGTGNNTYFIGFWQTEKYFKDIRDILVNEFKVVTPPSKYNQEMLTKITSSNAVMIHVRRGDYVKDTNVNSAYGTSSIDYYNNSIKLIKEKVEDPHFFIFSDDPDWAKANIKTDASTEVSYNPSHLDYEDMRLMYSCKHFIIANSTFSWWGAWLSENANKIVCAPKVWFQNSPIDTSDLVPEDWTRV